MSDNEPDPGGRALPRDARWDGDPEDDEKPFRTAAQLHGDVARGQQKRYGRTDMSVDEWYRWHKQRQWAREEQRILEQRAREREIRKAAKARTEEMEK